MKVLFRLLHEPFGGENNTSHVAVRNLKWVVGKTIKPGVLSLYNTRELPSLILVEEKDG